MPGKIGLILEARNPSKELTSHRISATVELEMENEEYKRYLKILELDPGASLTEIKNARRRLLRRYSQTSDQTLPLFNDIPEEKKGEIRDLIEEACLQLTKGLQESGHRKGNPKQNSPDDSGPAQNPENSGLPEIQITRSILRAEKVKKRFARRTVVNEVSIEVRTGEIIALLGRNGAGKTTTFLMMVGLLKPDGGTIYLDQKDISSYPTSRRAQIGITYLPQENSVFMKTTVENNLKMILENMGYKRKKRNEIAASMLGELGLSSLARQSAHSLSGGERRRLEICRSLVLNPKFLLLDEPFTGIDPITIRELQKILLHLKQKGIGIIISDHNVRDALNISERSYIIDEGEILIQGTPKEITASQKARERFLGKNFRLGDEIDRAIPR